MIDPEVLKAFKESIVGWISPENELVPCDLFGHFEVLKQRGLFLPEIAAYEAGMAEDSQAASDFSDSYAEDDHIPWHYYTAPSEEALDNLREKIYQAGWARVCIYIGRGTRIDGIWKGRLYVEGTEETLKRVKPATDFIGEMYEVVIDARIRFA